MSSELQWDIELVAGEICHESEAWPAWQRIRARIAELETKVKDVACDCGRWPWQRE